MILRYNNIILRNNLCREEICRDVFNIMNFEIITKCNNNISLYMAHKITELELKKILHIVNSLSLSGNKIKIIDRTKKTISLNSKSTIIPILSLLTGIINKKIDNIDAYIEDLNGSIDKAIIYSIIANMKYIASPGILSYHQYKNKSIGLSSGCAKELVDKLYERKVKNITRDETEAVEILWKSPDMPKPKDKQWKIINSMVYYLRMFKKVHLEGI